MKRAVLFDLDGTFVSGDFIESSAYEKLEFIHKSGVKTIAVTGRPAGWCDLMARWWPLDSVIGENGALSYYKESDRIVRDTYLDSKMLSTNQMKLAELVKKIMTKYPEIQLASDQSFRQWDIAIDIAEEQKVSQEISIDIMNICKEAGAQCALSNVHINVWFGDYNKRRMARIVLDRLNLDKYDTIYIGDSPNDSPMFRYIPLSVGVSSVITYTEMIDCLPKYVTKSDGPQGFIELLEIISLTK